MAVTFAELILRNFLKRQKLLEIEFPITFGLIKNFVRSKIKEL